MAEKHNTYVSPFVKKIIDGFSKNFILIFLGVYLVVGGLIFDDYGISIDESYEIQTARITINYVQGTSDRLLTYEDRHYGALFSIPLEYAAAFFQDSRNIFLFRHFATFMFFYFSVVIFYFTLRKLNFNKASSLLGVAALVLQPHIFANSFYNSKDIPFLGLSILAFFTLLLFAEKKTYTSTILHGLISGILVVFRIPGVLMWGTTLFVMLLLALNEHSQWKKMIGLGFLYLSIALAAMVLFLPALWHDPFHELLTMFSLDLLVWPNAELFLGKMITASTIPWYYLPLYFLVTTPFLYMVFFLFGSIGLAWQTAKQARVDKKFNINKAMILTGFFLPVVALLIARPLVYNGWRHIFFLYPAFVMIMVSGYSLIVEKIGEIKGRRSFLSGLVFAVAAFQFFVVGNFIVKSHPYQFTYYNFLAGPTLNVARNNFLMDYWGLSYQQALENILAKDTSEHITVTAKNPYYLSENLKILTDIQRQRLTVVEYGQAADHFITNYEDSLETQLSGWTLTSAILVDGAIISGTYSPLTVP